MTALHAAALPLWLYVLTVGLFEMDSRVWLAHDESFHFCWTTAWLQEPCCNSTPDTVITAKPHTDQAFSQRWNVLGSPSFSVALSLYTQRIS